MREKIQFLATSKTPQVIEIHKELAELANLAATRKIFLTDLIARLEAINRKINTNPAYKNVTFRNELYDTIWPLQNLESYF